MLLLTGLYAARPGSATLQRRFYLLCVFLPLPLALLHLAALLQLPLLLLPLAHCQEKQKTKSVSFSLCAPFRLQFEEDESSGKVKQQLTFLLQLVVVQQQADHLFGFERVRFEVASGDHYPLDLIVREPKKKEALIMVWLWSQRLLQRVVF